MTTEAFDETATGSTTAAALKSSWALLVGMSLLMVANGLQSTLLGVRSEAEGYPTFVTGIIMAGYFVGFLFGSTATTNFIGRVGHVRVFAALASAASISVLIHGVLIDPVTWTAMRFVTGFSYAGLYIVAESWLNDKADNHTRGKLLSIYMIVQFGSVSAGQLSLALGDPNGVALFIIASIAVSAGIVPILLSTSPAPVPDFSGERLKLTALVKVSPFGLTTAAAAGLLFGGYGGMGAVYASQMGLSLFQVSLFVSLVMIGGALGQFPIGSLSDRFDRRTVIIVASAVAAAISLVAATIGGNAVLALMIAATAFGAASLPLYSLALAYTNDYVPREQIVSASAGLVMVYGIASVFGPLTVSVLMDAMGPGGFFVYMAVLLGGLAAFGVYRSFARPALPSDVQTPYVPALSRQSPLATGVLEEEWENTETWEEDASEAADADEDAGADEGDGTQDRKGTDGIGA